MLDLDWSLAHIIRSLAICSHSTLLFLFQNNQFPCNCSVCVLHDYRLAGGRDCLSWTLLPALSTMSGT